MCGQARGGQKEDQDRPVNPDGLHRGRPLKAAHLEATGNPRYSEPF